MDPLAHQLTQRRIDFALPLDRFSPAKAATLDDQREMAFAARVVTGMADVLVALVLKLERVGASAAVSRSIIWRATGPVAASGIIPI
jgi:hypothetical protein